MAVSALGLVVLGGAWPCVASAQTDPEDIRNEYRVTLVTTRPAADREKVVFFQYLGVVDSNDKGVTSFYYSPPGLIIKPRKWAEVWVGMFGIYSQFTSKDSSWELRPLTGAKFYVPNHAKMNIFNFTRFEYRYVNQSHAGTTTKRLRNRVGFEVPFTQARAWTPRTWYGLADVEHFWQLDDGYLERYRVRGGIGYIISKTWRAEAIYHAEFSGDAGQPKVYKDNIFRLNIKLSLSRRGARMSIAPDIDE